MSELRLRLGEEDGRAFQSFLQDELAKNGDLKKLAVAFQPSKQPVGGFGMAVPPEVIVHFLEGAGVALGTGAVTEIGKRSASWLWDKLLEFFSQRAEAGRPVPSAIEVKVGDKREKIPLQKSTPEILTRIGTTPEGAE